MPGLIRSIATAALRRLTGDELPPMRALPAPQSSGLMVRKPQAQQPPMLYGTPVYREAPPPLPAPLPPAPPAPRRRKRITVTEEIFIRRG